MEYIVNGSQAREIDRCSIQEIGIPSMVLMEKAAMSVASCIMAQADKKQDCILVVCGTGNNGGDGVAAARMLQDAGYIVSVLVLGQEERCSEEMKQQISIARHLGVSVFWDSLTGKTTFTETSFSEYSIIVDAIFGIGLSRDVTGVIADYINAINRSAADVLAVDIPSGISADTGAVLGTAVKATITVTFGHNKRGLVLYPGTEYAGQVVVTDIGFPEMVTERVMKQSQTFTYTKEDLSVYFPNRKKRSNKGSYGRVVVIAGSKDMSGACYLSGEAAYRMGCGLVHIVTAQENAEVIRIKLPEAIVTGWAENVTAEQEADITAAIHKAAAVMIGPGLGQEAGAERLLDLVLQEAKKLPELPVVIDADGLNLLAKKGLYSTLGRQYVLTPHLREMSRLSGKSVQEIADDMTSAVMGQQAGATIVLKDARTLVSDGDWLYINLSGNSALSTGGSGDVLSGMIGGLLAQGCTQRTAATLAVYMHGLTAEQYCESAPPHCMLARDILEMIPKIGGNS
ncbi:MAG: hypothetical protein BHW05_05055 [Clostridium sp. 42_12]|nr:MAG: hypothetical protein BHW05_05055 [Clostridium sp. 42_12]